MDFELNWTIDLPDGWEYQGNCQVDVKLGLVWDRDDCEFYLIQIDGEMAYNSWFKGFAYHQADNDKKLQDRLTQEAISRGWIEPDPGHADLNWMDTKI